MLPSQTPLPLPLPVEVMTDGWNIWVAVFGFLGTIAAAAAALAAWRAARVANLTLQHDREERAAYQARRVWVLTDKVEHQPIGDAMRVDYLIENASDLPILQWGVYRATDDGWRSEVESGHQILPGRTADCWALYDPPFKGNPVLEFLDAAGQAWRRRDGEAPRRIDDPFWEREGSIWEAGRSFKPEQTSPRRWPRWPRRPRG